MRRPSWQATPVDQHEVTGRTEVSQVDVRGTGGAVRLNGGLRRIDLRQGKKNVLGLGQAIHADFLRVHDGDGAGTFDVQSRQARAGDFDSLDLLGGGRSRGLRGGLLPWSGLLRRLLRVSDLRRHQSERDFGGNDG